MKLSSLFLLIASGLLVLSGCASGRYKERQAEREKVAASSGMFCEFINGDSNPDVDVEMNFQMAKRCDSAKPFSISAYKNASDIHGMVYCCSVRADAKQSLPGKAPVVAPSAVPSAAKVDAKATAKPVEKAKPVDTKDADADIID